MRNDLGPVMTGSRPMRVDLGPVRADFCQVQADFSLERTGFRPEKVDDSPSFLLLLDHLEGRLVQPLRVKIPVSNLCFSSHTRWHRPMGQCNTFVPKNKKK